MATTTSRLSARSHLKKYFTARNAPDYIYFCAGDLVVYRVGNHEMDAVVTRVKKETCDYMFTDVVTRSGAYKASPTYVHPSPLLSSQWSEVITTGVKIHVRPEHSGKERGRSTICKVASVHTRQEAIRTETLLVLEGGNTVGPMAEIKMIGGPSGMKCTLLHLFQLRPGSAVGGAQEKPNVRPLITNVLSSPSGATLSKYERFMGKPTLAKKSVSSLRENEYIYFSKGDHVLYKHGSTRLQGIVSGMDVNSKSYKVRETHTSDAYHSVPYTDVYPQLGACVEWSDTIMVDDEIQFLVPGSVCAPGNYRNEKVV